MQWLIWKIDLQKSKRQSWKQTNLCQFSLFIKEAIAMFLLLILGTVHKDADAALLAPFKNLNWVNNSSLLLKRFEVNSPKIIITAFPKRLSFPQFGYTYCLFKVVNKKFIWLTNFNLFCKQTKEKTSNFIPRKMKLGWLSRISETRKHLSCNPR